MLHDKQLITVDASLWEAIGEQAQREKLTTEDWLRLQLQVGAAGTGQAPAQDADELMLDLVVRHFRDLDVSRDEQRWLAEAIATTIDSGEPTQVGPIGGLRRHYHIHRRVSAVSIRVGQGRVTLPLVQAMQLIALLGGVDELQLESVIAA